MTGWSWDGGYPMADLGPADAELADVMAEIAGSDYGAELASLAHVSGLIGLSAATEQQRLAEDAEDQLARRPTSEDQLARAIGRISRGTYSHALARDPLGQFATHG